MNTFVKGWQQIDSSMTATSHSAYLQLVQDNQQIRKMREEMYRRLEPVHGGVGVDIGCGLGLAVHELTMMGFKVTGVDISQMMINEARKRYPDLNFQIGNAFQLPFDDSSLDFCRVERVYVHVSKYELDTVLAEAYRVLKPGGRIVIGEPDLKTLLFTCSEVNKDLVDRFINAFVEVHPYGRVGSYARGHLINTGFKDVEVTGQTLTCTDIEMAFQLLLKAAWEAVSTGEYASQSELDELWQDLNVLQRRNAFQMSWSAFIISGCKPLV